jgi:hypothetical protein
MGCGCGGGGHTAPKAYSVAINRKSLEAARLSSQMHLALKPQPRMEIRKQCPRCGHPMNRFRKIDPTNKSLKVLLLCLNGRCRFQQEDK